MAGTPLIAGKVRERVLAPAAVSVGLTKEKETKDGRTKTVSWITPHMFRHTCASLLFDNGRNMKQVAG
jgi:integrase